MDPKMDSGLLKPGEEETTYEVLRPRLPEEIIGLMDQLLSSEVRLDQVTSLSQLEMLNVQSRCPGIVEAPSPRQYSHVFTSTTYYPRSQKRSLTLSLPAVDGARKI